ncbi:MAG: NRDE family protein [Chitinophagales bacterium]|nr:NRDE family protein [Chitinophagales bacterium]
MCTVSYVPITKNKFLLTSNRDETVARGLASAPQVLRRKDYSIACPVDPLASGTWIAASSNGDVLCLLNGAFKRHQRELPYRMSRGQVVMDYFDSGDPKQFSKRYDLHGVEPFTLVIVQSKKSPLLFELRWDGKKKHFKELAPDAFHLWSSVTLYDEEVSGKKKAAFGAMLNNQKKLTPEVLIAIHRNFIYEDWVFPPERVEVVSTLSITSIRQESRQLEMFYRDLVRKELSTETIRLPLGKR